MSDQKIKTSAEKAPLGLVPSRALVGPSRVFGYGAKKYAAGNYFQATLDDGAGSRYISAALRHLSEMQEPNGLHSPQSLAALDPESGLPHIDHVLCGLMMLRSIMSKCGAIAVDPGLGKEPPIVDAREAHYVALTGDRPVSKPLEVLAKEVAAEFPKLCRLCATKIPGNEDYCIVCEDRLYQTQPKHDLRTCETPECVEVRTTTLGPIEPARDATPIDTMHTADEFRVAFWPQVQGPSDFHDPTEGAR